MSEPIIVPPKVDPKERFFNDYLGSIHSRINFLEKCMEQVTALDVLWPTQEGEVLYIEGKVRDQDAPELAAYLREAREVQP